MNRNHVELCGNHCEYFKDMRDLKRGFPSRRASGNHLFMLGKCAKKSPPFVVSIGNVKFRVQ